MLLYSIICVFGVTNIIQHRYMPLFGICKNDKLYYGSDQRRKYKLLLGIDKFVQDHHCIPRQFRNHKLLREIEFDVNCSRNLMIMPNKKGIQELNLDPNILVHDGGHCAYNKYIGKQLTIISNEPTFDMKKYQIWLFLTFLKDNLQFNKENIPWI